MPSTNESNEQSKSDSSFWQKNKNTIGGIALTAVAAVAVAGLIVGTGGIALAPIAVGAAVVGVTGVISISRGIQKDKVQQQMLELDSDDDLTEPNNPEVSEKREPDRKRQSKPIPAKKIQSQAELAHYQSPSNDELWEELRRQIDAKNFQEASKSSASDAQAALNRVDALIEKMLRGNPKPELEFLSKRYAQKLSSQVEFARGGELRKELSDIPKKLQDTKKGAKKIITLLTKDQKKQIVEVLRYNKPGYAKFKKDEDVLKDHFKNFLNIENSKMFVDEHTSTKKSDFNILSRLTLTEFKLPKNPIASHTTIKFEPASSKDDPQALILAIQNNCQKVIDHYSKKIRKNSGGPLSAFTHKSKNEPSTSQQMLEAAEELQQIAALAQGSGENLKHFYLKIEDIESKFQAKNPASPPAILQLCNDIRSKIGPKPDQLSEEAQRQAKPASPKA